VYLNDEEAEGLRALARATGKSQAELIREGVRRLLRKPPKRTFHSLAQAPPAIRAGGAPTSWQSGGWAGKPAAEAVALIVDAGALYSQADRLDPSTTPSSP